MRITVRVKPGSKVESVEKSADGELVVRVKAPAKEGKANTALVKALSNYFDIPKSRISISGGLSSKNKIVDIY